MFRSAIISLRIFLENVLEGILVGNIRFLCENLFRKWNVGLESSSSSSSSSVWKGISTPYCEGRLLRYNQSLRNIELVLWYLFYLVVEIRLWKDKGKVMLER